MQSSSLEAVVVDQVTPLTVVVAVGHQAEMLVTAALVAVVVDHRMVVDLLVTLVLTAAQVLNLTVATVVALVLAEVEVTGAEAAVVRQVQVLVAVDQVTLVESVVDPHPKDLLVVTLLQVATDLTAVLDVVATLVVVVAEALSSSCSHK
jgi:hypothetical protein